MVATVARGGDVILVADPDLHTLLDFEYESVFSAESGVDGAGKHCDGKYGADCIVRVPPGSMVYEQASGQQVADLVVPGDRLIAARGGDAGCCTAGLAAPDRTRASDIGAGDAAAGLCALGMLDG